MNKCVNDCLKYILLVFPFFHLVKNNKNDTLIYIFYKSILTIIFNLNAGISFLVYNKNIYSKKFQKFMLKNNSNVTALK